MPDERDRYRPKTPPIGSPAARHRPGTDKGSGSGVTPVENEIVPDWMPRALKQTSEDLRTKIVDVSNQVVSLGGKVASQEIKIVKLADHVEGVDQKVNEILDESRENRAERIAREARREAAAEQKRKDDAAERDRELQRKHERMMKFLTIFVPSIIAFGGLIAGILAAYNSSKP